MQRAINGKNAPRINTGALSICLPANSTNRSIKLPSGKTASEKSGDAGWENPVGWPPEGFSPGEFVEFVEVTPFSSLARISGVCLESVWESAFMILPFRSIFVTNVVFLRKERIFIGRSSRALPQEGMAEVSWPLAKPPRTISTQAGPKLSIRQRRVRKNLRCREWIRAQAPLLFLISTAAAGSRELIEMPCLEADLCSLIPEILQAIQSLKPGQVIRVS